MESEGLQIGIACAETSIGISQLFFDKS